MLPFLFFLFLPHNLGLLLLLLSRFSRVRLCETPQTAAHQAPPSLGFSRQEHWSGLPFPSPMHESEKLKGSRSVVSHSSDPMDCSLPGSSIHGIFQARVLEGVPLPSPNLGLEPCYSFLGDSSHLLKESTLPLFLLLSCPHAPLRLRSYITSILTYLRSRSYRHFWF